MSPRRPSPPFAYFALGMALCACAVDTHGKTEATPPEEWASASSSSVSGTGGSGGGTGGSAGAGGGQGGQGGAIAVCGNGKLNQGELCDDGNVTPADGCGADCQPEDSNACDGVKIKLAKGDTLTISDNTTNGTDKVKQSGGTGSCGTGTYTGPDLVYAVIPMENAMLVATLTASYQYHWLHIHTGCPGGPSQEIACDYGMSMTSDSVSVMVMAGNSYYVFADGTNDTAGPFSLTLELQ